MKLTKTDKIHYTIYKELYNFDPNPYALATYLVSQLKSLKLI